MDIGMDIGATINKIMREVPRLSPSDPSVHFLRMLEAEGLTIVNKVEVGADLAVQAVEQAALQATAPPAPSPVSASPPTPPPSPQVPPQPDAKTTAGLSTAAALIAAAKARKGR
jgi:hypothetical protein